MTDLLTARAQAIGSVALALGRGGLDAVAATLRLGGFGWSAVLASSAVGYFLARQVRTYGPARSARPALMALTPLVTWSALTWSRGPDVLWSLGLGWTLLALAAIDVVAMRLPDILTLPLAAAGLLQAWSAQGDERSRLLGGVLGGVAFWALAKLYERVRGRSGLGLGDAKLLAAAGAWLGLEALPDVVLTACGFAFVGVLVRLGVNGRPSLGRPLAFGAPLALAMWIGWLQAGSA